MTPTLKRTYRPFFSLKSSKTASRIPPAEPLEELFEAARVDPCRLGLLELDRRLAELKRAVSSVPSTPKLACSKSVKLLGSLGESVSWSAADSVTRMALAVENLRVRDQKEEEENVPEVPELDEEERLKMDTELALLLLF